MRAPILVRRRASIRWSNVIVVLYTGHNAVAKVIPYVSHATAYYFHGIRAVTDSTISQYHGAMVSVLIVDDEKLTRDGLSTRMHWDENGFAPVGTAASAYEALARMEDSLPDIFQTIKKTYKSDLSCFAKVLKTRLVA